MVIRTLNRVTKPRKNSNSEHNPHKSHPDKYYRSIWADRQLWEILEMIAEIERTTPQVAAIHLLRDAAQQYIEEGIQHENETRELIKTKMIPYKPPGRFIKVLRGYLAKHGVENPRIDNHYPSI
jgi:hypothetical protein